MNNLSSAYFDNAGYLNIKNIMSKKPNIVMLIGGRGIGKTYGVLDYILKNKMIFILIRRTTTEREFIRNVNFNPLNKFLDAENFVIDTGKYIDTYIYNDRIIAYCTNLSTVGKIRGLSGDTIQVLFFDEFIAEKTERRMTDEATALFQLYETVNRNRELSGAPPLKMFLCANSNNVFNDIIDTLKLTDYFMDMRESGRDFRYIKSKKIFLGDIKHSPISEKKKNTYLYTLTKDTNFFDMAINNKFSNDYRDFIGMPYQWKEYKPFCDIRDVHVLKHINKNILFVTRRNRGTARKKYFKITDFFKEYNLILSRHFVRRSIFFENSEIACLFQDFII